MIEPLSKQMAGERRGRMMTAYLSAVWRLRRTAGG